jgi:hypothetical protein
MKTQSISRSDLKQIHNVACDGWKTKIEKLASRNAFGDLIELSQAEVDEMFEASDEKQTKVLSKFFKKSTSKVDEINSFEDACAVLEITDSKDVIEKLSLLPSSMSRRLIALYKLETIIKALNDGWFPNWKDTNQRKFWNWFRRDEGGFSFVYTDCNYYCSTVPSALCFKTSELAQHCAKIAIKEYEEYYS